MDRRQTARLALRAATAEDHARVDRAFSPFDLSTRDGYANFLQAQAAAFLPLEAAVDAADPRNILPDWDQRRRSHLLAADLAALGVAVGPIDPVSLTGAAEVLGSAYVLEGSRLGGTMLARTVPAHFPRRFLDANDSGLWRSLIEMLDATLVTADDRRAAAQAARSAFAAFERSARRQLELADLA